MRLVDLILRRRPPLPTLPDVPPVEIDYAARRRHEARERRIRAELQRLQIEADMTTRRPPVRGDQRAGNGRTA